MNIINDWFKRFLSDRQMIILAMLLLTGLLAILFAGRYLTPVIASLIIAYLLEGVILKMQRLNIPRILAVSTVFTVFFVVMLVLLFLLVPLLIRQANQLLQEVPQMLIEGQRLVLTLPEKYPTFLSEIEIENLLNQIRREAVNLTDAMLRQTLSSVVGIITIVVYIVLVPLLVFFFLKDKASILEWARSYLPKERGLASGVWQEVDAQLGNFIRGKFWEILLVGSASCVTFILMGLDFAVLLAFLVGISVLVPYLGAVVATFPVALVAYFQFGWSSDLAWIMVAYGVIQLLDGNVLVPVLFSEVVNLHPIAIIVAVLFFGGVWGFWGVFFAIPLAILLQSVLKALVGQVNQNVFE